MPSESGTIFDIQRYALHDGHGIRTLVFLKGCPLRCAWCHNPEGQERRPQVLRYADGEEKVAGRTATADEVLAEVERDTLFFDESGGGVTFSGGDPLMQPGFLLALLRAAKAHDLGTAVETAGYARWQDVDGVRPYVDRWLYDVKVFDDARHREWTGVSNRRILQNLRRLALAGARVTVRIPLVPGVNDDEANLLATGRFLLKLGLDEVHLLPYHRAGLGKYERLGRAYALLDLREPSADEMARHAEVLERCGLKTRIGG